MDNNSQSGQLPPLNRALLAIEKMEARLKAMENWQREPIAIIGLGCRFPGGATDAESFWKLLRDGVDTVTDVPANRWDIDAYYDANPEVPGKMYTRKGAFLEEVDQFDPQFFGIMPKEAHAMDPQQRLLLETTWEALENAGIAPDSLAGSRTGVYVGILGTDYAGLQTTNGGIHQIGPYYGSGVAHSIASGRISYLLGLQGPSLSIDTACSSSLVAIHQACLSLRSRETHLALAGGVNLIITPDASIALSKNKMMAADGHCKTFDASADGYVRGEGCGMVILKRLSEALTDGDNILAVIRGIAVNQDGASSGLTAPNGPAQEAVIRDALINAGIEPQDVTYVEAHGTGTALGDPIEVQALASVLGKSREAHRPLLIGSVKTNVGHLETAAGIAGLVKLIMALRYKTIPPHLHLKKPNPFIPWGQLPVSIPTKLTPWPDGAPLVAGLSSFGFSGTNVHLVISAPPEKESKAVVQAEGQPIQLITLSAKSESALPILARQMAAYLDQNPNTALPDLAHTLNTGRAKFGNRLALWAGSVQEAQTKFKAFSNGEEPAGFISGHILHNKRLKIAFLFTGQGAQYTGMGRQMYESQPVFREVMNECDSLLRSYLPQPLLDVIFADAGSERAALLDQTLYTQPALFAIEYSLAKLWQSWGVEPFAVMGHSVGEYVAACLAGVFSLQDGLVLIAERGRLMQSLPPGGKMSAVFASEATVQAAIQPFADHVSIAAINGSDSIVISGDGQSIDDICTRFEAKSIKTRPLKVSHAFHSVLVEPILNDFEQVAASIQYKKPQLRLVSNLTGKVEMGETLARAAYWREHIRKPVRFAQGVESLLELNIDSIVEVGPSPTLLGMVKHISGTDEKLSLPTLRQGRGDWSQMFESLSKLFVHGVKLNWAGLNLPNEIVNRLELPTYPFQRQRYWIAPQLQTVRKNQSDKSAHRLLGSKLSSPLKTIQFEVYLERESFTFIRDHQVNGISILPMTAYLEMAQASAKLSLGAGQYELRDVVIQQPMVLNDDDVRIVHATLNHEGLDAGSFEIYSHAKKEDDDNDWQLNASGRIGRVVNLGYEAVEVLEDIKLRCTEQFTGSQHYQELNERGFPFGPAMQGVNHIWRQNGEALVEIWMPAEIADEFNAFDMHPALLDAALQGFWVTFDLSDKKTYIPISIENYSLFRPVPDKIWSHISLREDSKVQTDSKVGDIRVFDEKGVLVAEIKGLYFRPAATQLLKKQHEWGNWFYEVEWQLQPAAVGAALYEASVVASPELLNNIDAQVTSLSQEHHIDRYKELFPQIERLSAGYVAEALHELGLQYQVGQQISLDELMTSLHILGRYRRLTSRFFDILSDAGFLQKIENNWHVIKIPGAEINLQYLKANLQRLLDSYPESYGQLTLTGQCGAALAGVLRGQVDPLSLLFPNGSLEMTELLYRESPQPRVFNTMVRNYIQQVQEGVPADKKLRILEIGAGTGGTTSYVLPALSPDQTEYYFTDISPLFLSRAKERFSQFNFVNYEILNIENDPASQGFADQSFDIVLAVNVLHATVDMRETLEHARQLMKPNGLLLLVEGTKPENWVDITFGLTDGWWRFADSDLRVNYPLMMRETWRKLLSSTGFKDIGMMPFDETHFQQALIVARAEFALAGDWLIFTDNSGVGQVLAEHLASFNQSCVFVKAGREFRANSSGYEVNPTSGDDFNKLLSEVISRSSNPLLGVVYLWPLNMGMAFGKSLDQTEGLGGAVYLTQALAMASLDHIQVWLITRGTQQVSARELLAIEESTLWGLGKVVQLEHPELNCTRIDLDAELTIAEQAKSLFAQIWKPDEEDQIAIRGDARYLARLKRMALNEQTDRILPFDEKSFYQLQTSGTGVLEDLIWQPAILPELGAHEVAIEVCSTGLNFRDLMNALAMRSDREALGGECSGVIRAVGSGVTHFKTGDPVLGMVRGSFGNVAIADADFVAKKPDELSFAEAAGIPIAYFTAYYCLEHIVKIAKGQKILIHAAAGGVGMAAVKIALRAGAEVYATAGNEAKRKFLKSMGVAHVFNSRELGFVEGILTLTSGKGVDVILNSLAGEFIPQSVSLLVENGSFIEIGKRDIWTTEQFLKEKPLARYHVIDLAALTASDPKKVAPIFVDVMDLVRRIELSSLPIKDFPARDVVKAFRYMAQAQHIGKIVTTYHSYCIRPDAVYLITGGLAGLGLLTAQHLVHSGARHLLLVGRSAPSSGTETAIREFEAKGCLVDVFQADVSKAEDVRLILDYVRQKKLALRGVIHAAGVLDDASILRQEWSKYERVLAPKVDGAWHLHNFTMNEPLDFFILYSSTAALLGSPGQSNHAAANTFMDSLAHYRQLRGLPALSINWGIWSEIGSAAARNADEWMLSQGVGTIKPDQGLEMLDLLFSQDHAQIAVLPIAWDTYLSQFKKQPLWLQNLSEEAKRKNKNKSKAPAPVSQKMAGNLEVLDLIQQIAKVPLNQQRQFLLEHVHAQVLKAIGLESGHEIDPRQPLNELGLDSLMAVELRNMLSNSLKLVRNLPATLVFDYPTINALTDYLAQNILKIETEKDVAKAEPDMNSDVLMEIERLSDEDVNRMLSDLQG